MRLDRNYYLYFRARDGAEVPARLRLVHLVSGIIFMYIYKYMNLYRRVLSVYPVISIVYNVGIYVTHISIDTLV